MISLVFLMSLHCPQTILINSSGFNWNSDDRVVYNSSLVRCGVIFPTYDCVKVFIKTEERNYNVICGKKK